MTTPRAAAKLCALDKTCWQKPIGGIMAEVTIRAADGGGFSAYLPGPKTGKAPGLVLFKGIFAVNKVMGAPPDAFAPQGSTAMSPDLFWPPQPPPPTSH